LPITHPLQGGGQGWGLLPRFVGSHHGGQQAEQLFLLLLAQRSDQSSGHHLRAGDQLLQRLEPFGREVDRLAASVAGVALASDEAARLEPRDDLGHRRAVERDSLAERSLIDVGLAVESVQRRELWGCDRARHLLAPEQVHDLQRSPHQVTRVQKEILGRVEGLTAPVFQILSAGAPRSGTTR